MHRVGRLFDDVTAFPALVRAHRMAFKGSGRSEEACGFDYRREQMILELKDELESGRYRPRPYRYFRIREPKPRTISVAAYRDRVVHHALVGVLEPIFERRFICHSYATRRDKGTHRAVALAQEHLRKNRYFLKSDIKSYFDSVRHSVLLEQIGRVIKDERVMELIRLILDNNDLSQNKADGRGLPIGNLTSQFFANVYLNGFDHFVLERLGARYYVRYMDDLVFFAASVGRLKAMREKIRVYLASELDLRLKEEATFINSRENGLPFLGYRIFPRLLRIKRENLKRIRRKAATILMRLDSRLGEDEERRARQSLASYFGYIGFANTYQWRRSWLVNSG